MLGQMSLLAPNETKLKNRVQIERISLKDARYMLEKFHYLHRTRTGRQINYAVMIDGIIDGVITYAYPMTSCPINGIPSDELIEFARLYLSQNIPHSATCAIGKSIRRIKSDWMLLFPDAKPPRMIVSWSDTTRHKGTIYKAANFTWLKKSRSLGIPHSEKSKRGKRISTPDRLNEKDCWIYMLSD